MSVRVDIELNGARVPVTLDEEALQAIAEAVPPVLFRNGEQWPEWMRLPTAAKYLDLSEHALRKRAGRGEIAYSQEGHGCALWFARRDLDEHMGRLRIEARRSV